MICLVNAGPSVPCVYHGSIQVYLHMICMGAWLMRLHGWIQKCKLVVVSVTVRAGAGQNAGT